MKLSVFIEDIVKSIVKNPDMVKVAEFGGEEESVILEIMVSEDDMGAVIGKGGKMAGSIRTLAQAYAYLHDNKKVKINIDKF